MSAAFNRVIVAGNLTRDPELKTLEGNRVVGRLSLAINRNWRNANGERKEEVTFVDCEAWGRSAEIAGQYLTKGSPCLIEGRLKMDQWESQEGKKQSRLKVIAENIQFLGGRSDSAPSEFHQPRPQAPARRIANGPSLEDSVRATVPDDEPPF